MILSKLQYNLIQSDATLPGLNVTLLFPHFLKIWKQHIVKKKM
jgi:hypothetical protein